MKAQEAIAYASAMDKNLQLFVDKETNPDTELKLWEVGSLSHQSNEFDPSLGTHFELNPSHKLTRLLLETLPKGQRAIVVLDCENSQPDKVFNLVNTHTQQYFAIDALNNNVLPLNTIDDKCLFDEQYQQHHSGKIKVSFYITGAALT